MLLASCSSNCAYLLALRGKCCLSSEEYISLCVGSAASSFLQAKHPLSSTRLHALRLAYDLAGTSQLASKDMVGQKEHSLVRYLQRHISNSKSENIPQPPFLRWGT